MNQGSILLGFVGVVVVATVATYFFVTPPPAHIGVLIDTSVSVDRKCQELKDFTVAVIARHPAFRNGSSLSMLTMGGSAANAQPRLQWSGAIPFGTGVVFGQDAERDQEAQEEFEAQIENACASAEPSTHSPIFEMTRQGIAHLRSGNTGCKDSDTCMLIVKTDLEDDVHPLVKRAIGNLRNGKIVALPDELRGVLDNRGMQVQFCGLSELAKRSRNSPAVTSQEDLKRLWQSFFSDPALVSFQPYCR